MGLAAGTIETIRQEFAGSGFGARTRVISKWADLMGMSPQQIRRYLKEPDGTDRTDKTNQQYKAWTEIIYQIKKRPPEDAGEISTWQAAKIGALNGLIPEEALAVSRSTFDRIARGMNLTKSEKHIVRFQAERPNQVHHFDASTSKFLYVARKVGDEYVIKIHRPSKHYKNKPIPCDRMRPWIYGLVDDHSGYHVARYAIAQGESPADSLLFLEHGWRKIGIPQKLFSDQGMLKRCLASADLVHRLNVELPQMMPYNKEAHGKIERPWRTCWKAFELQFFAMDDWEKWEISHTDLNGMLTNYLESHYNLLAHRYEKEISREQAWRRVNLYGGMIPLPEGAMATAARSITRVVGVDGCFSLDGVTYEVKGLHAAEVRVFEGIFEDKIVVQDLKTGIKYDVKKFKPLAIDQFKAFPKTAHEKAVEEGKNLTISHVMFETPRAEEKVLKMPVRQQQAAPLEDPFDVDRYASMGQAMAEVIEIVGYIPQEQREQVEELITRNGFDKAYVRTLSMRLFEAGQKKRQAI